LQQAPTGEYLQQSPGEILYFAYLLYKTIITHNQLILQQKNSSIASDGHAATPPIIKTTNIPSRSAMRTSSSVKASLQYVAAIAPKDTPLCVKSATNADIKVVTSETINHQPLVEDVPSKKTVDNRKREAYEAWKAEQLCKKQC
jgi:hypothetical protein